MSWNNIQKLKKRYGNTMTTTLWHMIEERNPKQPAVALISRHPRQPSVGSGADGENWRHFIRSKAFRQYFPHIGARDIYATVGGYVGFSTKGPVGQSTIPLEDVNGDIHEFYFESFSNSYDLLTFGVAVRRMPVSVKAAQMF